MTSRVDHAPLVTVSTSLVLLQPQRLVLWEEGGWEGGRLENIMLVQSPIILCFYAPKLQ